MNAAFDEFVLRYLQKASRPNWDEYGMANAILQAKMATCVHHQIGCVVLNTDHILVGKGFNGPPSGIPHCIDAGIGCAKDKGELCVGAHAEMNAAALSTGSPYVVFAGGTLYTTASPCNQCLKELINMKIWRIVYAEVYSRRSGRGDTEDFEGTLLTAKKANIWIVHFDLETGITHTKLEGRKL